MLEFGLSLAEFAIYEFVTKKEWEGRDGKARKGKKGKGKRKRKTGNGMEYAATKAEENLTA